MLSSLSPIRFGTSQKTAPNPESAIKSHNWPNNWPITPDKRGNKDAEYKQATVLLGLARLVGFTPIHYAAFTGNSELVRALAEKGVDINKSSYLFGDTPIRAAAAKGHAKVVLELIKAGVDVNKAGWFGITPLYVAANKGHIDTAKALIESGADVNKAAWLATPLRTAVRHGQTELATLLREHGATE